MAAKQVSRSRGKRQDLNATIQWVALIGVFALIVLAIFVFNVGGAGTGGHSN